MHPGIDGKQAVALRAVPFKGKIVVDAEGFILIQTQSGRERSEESRLHGAVAGGENHHVALQLFATAVQVMLDAEALPVLLARQRRHRAGRHQVRPGFFAQHFEAVIHSTIDGQQRLRGDPVGGHLLLLQHLATGVVTEGGEAVHILRREIFVSKRGFIQRVEVVATRDPVEAQRLAPFPTEDIQKQIRTALAAADDGDAPAC